VITTAQSAHLSQPEDALAKRTVEISTEPRSDDASVLRNILRQPWFTSLSLFFADLVLVSGAYLLSRTIRVNQALEMSPAYLVQVGVFFVCILTAVGLIGGYKARRTFQALHFAAEFILAVIVGASVGAFILFVFFSAGDFYTAQSRVVLFYTAIGYALPALGLRLLAASVWTRRARRVPYLAIGTTAELSDFARYCERMDFHNPVVLADLDLQVVGGLMDDQARALRPRCGTARARFRGHRADRSALRLSRGAAREIGTASFPPHSGLQRGRLLQ
jgi:hypothetical protein